MKTFLVCAILLVGGSSILATEEGKLTAEAARKLLPRAAGMSNQEFQLLATRATPPSLDEDGALTYVLMALVVTEAPDKDSEKAKEFSRSGGGPPKPSDLAKLLAASKWQGFASAIQEKYITDCTCESTADRAEGVVTFKTDLYSGRIPFVAQATKDGWTITEFHLPQHEIKLTRDADGHWKQTAMPAD